MYRNIAESIIHVTAWIWFDLFFAAVCLARMWSVSLKTYDEPIKSSALYLRNSSGNGNPQDQVRTISSMQTLRIVTVRAQRIA